MSYQPGRRGRWSWGLGRGLGYASPIGFADEASFQTAVIASYPPCPLPFDPACENPRDAAIAANLNDWVSNPQSCHNIVCNVSGQPAVAMGPTGNVGYNTTSGFVATTPTPATAAPASTPSARSMPTGTIVSPRPVRRPVPIQSASPAAAPGGPSAPAAAPIPVQTQTPPDSTATQDMTGGAAAPDLGAILSAIPIWGWGIGVVILVLATRGGKR